MKMSTGSCLLAISLFTLSFLPPTPASADDRRNHMTEALEHLRAARSQLDQAKGFKGEHRDRAIESVDRAIRQVRESLEYHR